MGAKQSKRSLDITSSPNKNGEEICQQPLEDGKMEKIEDMDNKPAVNGTTPHSAEPDIQEVVMKNGAEHSPTVEAESPENDVVNATITEDGVKAEENEANKESEAGKQKKEKKEKAKKKFSFRSFSFSKKDKSKPKDETNKNGELIKDESVKEEGGESKAEGETNSPTEASPTSPTEAPSPPTEVCSPTETEPKESKPENTDEIENLATKVEEMAIKPEEPCPEKELKTEEVSQKEPEVPEVSKESSEAAITEAQSPAKDEDIPPPLPASPPPPTDENIEVVAHVQGSESMLTNAPSQETTAVAENMEETITETKDEENQPDVPSPVEAVVVVEGHPEPEDSLPEPPAESEIKKPDDIPSTNDTEAEPSNIASDAVETVQESQEIKSSEQVAEETGNPTSE